MSCCGVLVLISPVFVSAETTNGASLSSDGFRILDSQQTIFGGTASSSSSHFGLTAVIGGFAIGSSSFTSFGLRSGFLYYPKVTAPVLNTATGGNGQVALSWSAATAYQGWSIGGYNVCHKSSGSYTCVDTSSTSTSYTKTGLTNGTTYTFKIQAYDGVATKNIIAESNEKTATPVAAATPTPTPPPSGGGGGGGGGYVASGVGTIIIRGTAFVNSTVTIYLDGGIVSSVKAGSSANFDVKLDGVQVGSRNIGINSEDANGRKSITSNFVATITAGTTVTLTDIFVAPTIDINNINPAKGEIVQIFGQAAPMAEVDVHVSSNETVNKIISDSNGSYAVKYDTKPLTEDEHTAKSRAILSEAVSPFSRVLQFFVGKGAAKLKTADLNKDGKVNIIDFSILLYWWGTKNSKGLEIADINKDGKVNITDFSIMLFQWTG